MRNGAETEEENMAEDARRDGRIRDVGADRGGKNADWS